MPEQRHRCRARKMNTDTTIHELISGLLPMGFVAGPKPCDLPPPTLALQSSGEDDGPLASSQLSETSDSADDALFTEMNFQGASFAAQARAAELNAAAAAKARNGEMDPRFNSQLPAYVSRAHQQPLFGNLGGHNMTPSKQMKLSAEAPHYTPKGMDNSRFLNRSNVRVPPRYATSGNNMPKGAHPLRNVTTLDTLTGNAYGDAGVLHNYPLGPDSKNTPGGLRFMGPDDVSPTKQEEKLALRDRGYSQGTVNQGDMDPFVSRMSEFPVHHGHSTGAYDTAAHQGHVGQGQMSGYGENFAYTQPSGYHGYADLHSHARVSTNEHDNLPSMETGVIQHPAARFSNQHQAAMLEASYRHSRGTLVSSVATNPSTPARGAVNSGSERVNIDSSGNDHIGRNPDYGQIPLDAVKLHSGNNNVSCDLGPTHDDLVAQHHPSSDTKPQKQYPGSNLENPLHQSNYHQGIPVQSHPLSNNGYPYHVQTASQSQTQVGQTRYIDAYGHLNYWERPVPWAVARAGAVLPRVSMTTPPPGLPLPPGRTDDGDQALTPEQLEKEEKKREARARADSGEQTLRQLNDRIREIALEEREKRIKAGGDKAAAENSADMTILLGQALVSLSSYMTGDPDDQPRGFAQFGPVPEHTIEPSNGGRRSLFDIDPRADAWRLPPPRGGANPGNGKGDGGSEGDSA